MWRLILTWIKFNPSWKNNCIHQKLWDEITYYPFQNISRCAVKDFDWVNNFITPLLDMWLLIHAEIKVPCWEKESLFVKMRLANAHIVKLLRAILLNWEWMCPLWVVILLCIALSGRPIMIYWGNLKCNENGEEYHDITSNPFVSCQSHLRNSWLINTLGG